MGALATVVMSATTFAGSAQFAAASILDTGGTVAAAITAAVFLNARYVAISISIASIFPGGRLRRFFESQLIVDESWALSGRSGRFEWPILIGAGLLLYVLWVSSTALGTLIGGALEDPNELGLDAAFAVLFLALALPYLRERRALQAAALGGAITLVLLRSRPPASRSSRPPSPVSSGSADDRRLDRGRRRRCHDDALQGDGPRVPGAATAPATGARRGRLAGAGDADGARRHADVRRRRGRSRWTPGCPGWRPAPIAVWRGAPIVARDGDRRGRDGARASAVLGVGDARAPGMPGAYT